MKKLFFVICMMLMSVSTFAQQGTATIGAHGVLGLSGNKNMGIGANIGYEVINNVRGVAEFDYFFKKDYVTQWLVQANAEYLFRVADGFAIYPLAGINLYGFKWDADLWGTSESDSKVGMTIGGGVEYQIIPSLALKVEYNYLTQYDGASLLKFGVVIPF